MRNQHDPLRERCRTAGIPVTWQRRAVYDALLARDDHPTADDLLAVIRGAHPGVSRTTIYRVLETLVGIGLARRVPHPGAAVRFDGITEPHHHVLCVSCGSLRDLADRDLGLSRLGVPDAEFEVHDVSVFIRGLCPACRRGSRSATTISRKTRRNRS